MDSGYVQLSDMEKGVYECGCLGIEILETKQELPVKSKNKKTFIRIFLNPMLL